MIDVRKVRMLVELERLGTVAGVAQELHLTAPGVSTQLRVLERELGVTLTERRGRRLALTPAGRLVAARGRDVLDRLALAQVEVDALRAGTVGTYRVAAFPTAAGTFVADTWRTLPHRAPSLDVRLVTLEPEQALAGLLAGDVDLAVVHGYSNVPRDLPDQTSSRPLVTEPVHVALPAADPLGADVVDLAALAGRPWLAPRRDLTCFAMVERACGLAGFSPDVVVETVDFAVQLELVAAGVGVALVPHLAAQRVPDGVRLARPATAVHRTVRTVRRAASRADAGLDLVDGLLAETAVARVPGDLVPADDRGVTRGPRRS